MAARELETNPRASEVGRLLPATRPLGDRRRTRAGAPPAPSSDEGQRAMVRALPCCRASALRVDDGDSHLGPRRPTMKRPLPQARPASARATTSLGAAAAPSGGSAFRSRSPHQPNHAPVLYRGGGARPFRGDGTCGAHGSMRTQPARERQRERPGPWRPPHTQPPPRALYLLHKDPARFPLAGKLAATGVLSRPMASWRRQVPASQAPAGSQLAAEALTRCDDPLLTTSPRLEPGVLRPRLIK